MTHKVKKTCLAIPAVLLIIFLVSALSAGYLHFKQILLAKVSGRITSTIGQKVEIEDAAFSLATGLYVHNIIIRNPEGFGAGRLLKIKRLRISMQWGELLKGRLHFKDIGVYSPELTLLRNSDGKLNIADKFRRLFSGKSTGAYQVDRLTMDSGALDLYNDARYRISGISLSVKNLSPAPRTKTLMQGSASWKGTGRIGLEGWAYLKDEPKRFSLSLFAENLAPGGIKNILDNYGVDTERTVIAASLHARGDTDKGCSIQSDIRIKGVGTGFLRKELETAGLSTKAFFSIPDDSLTVHEMSLRAGNATAAHLKGVIRNILKEPSYSATAGINAFDLSSLNILRDMKISGSITSGDLTITGNFRALPAITGSVQLQGGAFKTAGTEIENINASAKLSSAALPSALVRAAARIRKAGGCLFTKPAETSLLLNTRWNPGKLAIDCSADLSSFAVNVGGNRTAYLDDTHFSFAGGLRDKAFTGTSSLELKGMRYGDHTVLRLAAKAGVDAKSTLLALSDLHIETEKGKASASLAKISTPGGSGGYSADIENMNASYAAQGIGLKDCTFAARVLAGPGAPSGDLLLSAKHVVLRGRDAGAISGSAQSDGKTLSLHLTGTGLFGGRLRLAARGNASGDIFPLRATAALENIDLSALSQATALLVKTPYTLSGSLKSASFDGVIDSARSVRGNASAEITGGSVLKSAAGKEVLKDLSLSAGVRFSGKDLELKTDASAKNLSLRLSGTIGKFAEKSRSAKLALSIPEVKAADLRDSLWEIFPDSLLYAGLEGSFSSEALIDYNNGKLKVNGNVAVKELTLTGENSEYAVGPINGNVPIAYGKSPQGQGAAVLPAFEREAFDALAADLSREPAGKGSSRLTIGRFDYGFRLMDAITLRIRTQNGVLHIERFSANIFGGKILGSALAGISGGLTYRAGILLKGLSMKTLGESVEPVKGYISGKIDGIASLKGSGAGLSGLIGKADFWTYGAKKEKTRISKEFLRKMGGPSVRTYLRDRPFDKGIMSLYIQDGFVIFKELEISNRNFFGMQDLSVKVAPFNNRISLDRLMWTITEAAQRAKNDRNP